MTGQRRAGIGAVAAVLAAVAGLSACAAGSPGASTPPHRRPASAAATVGPLSRPTWLEGVTLTEYWPVPERWFVGRRVHAPGIPGVHRVDWLYSVLGLIVEEDGVALDGKRYHVDQEGRVGYVNRAGRPVSIASDSAYWRNAGFWRNAAGGVTFPLERGGWKNGVGVRYVPLRGVRFARGPSLALSYYRSIAVDPKLIPKNSRVYIPAYRRVNGGWFVAQDTGTSIHGRHIDVFRPAPPNPNAGRYLKGQRVLVVPPGQPLPATLRGGRPEAVPTGRSPDARGEPSRSRTGLGRPHGADHGQRVGR